MGWRDRDYNRGSEAAREFFGNPASILSFAVPAGRWFGARVTLHFWLLLTFLFIFVYGARVSMAACLTGCGVLLASAFLHELGHRFMAQRVGGQHEEFVLWPFGGMSTPVTPPTPGAIFQGNVGGILVNALLAGGAFAALAAMGDPWPLGRALSPLAWIRFAFAWPEMLGTFGGMQMAAAVILMQIAVTNVGMIIGNLLPYSWFDGANLWQAILWPMTGTRKAVTITCWAGFIIAVPMFFLSLSGGDFFGMILWFLLFSNAWQRRQQLKAAGPDELLGNVGYGTAYGGSAAFGGGGGIGFTPDEKPQRRRSGWWKKNAAKKAQQERAEQVKIDRILDKVHEQGLHSLTRAEKKTLKKATERQRQQELAQRKRERA